MFFVLEEAQADAFATAANGIASGDDYNQLVERFGVRRSSDHFWEIYDEINAVAQREQRIERGTLDLTRHELDRR